MNPPPRLTGSMHKPRYDAATVAVLDPVSSHRNATRAALYATGFREIETYLSVSDLRDALGNREVDLLILDATADAAAVHDFVSALRRGRVGKNPFAVTILTAWTTDGAAIKAGLDCGADDIVKRPFSTNQLAERFRLLTEQRKGFVVTSDYIGPDRRRDVSRSDGRGLVEVVNSLRLKAVEGLSSAEAAAAIQRGLAESRAAIDGQRMLRGAFQIGVLAGLLKDAASFADAAAMRRGDIERIVAIAKDIARLAEATEHAAAAKTCETVQHIARTAASGIEFGRNADLLMELSIALQASLMPGRGASDLEAELTETLAKVRARGRRH